MSEPAAEILFDLTLEEEQRITRESMQRFAEQEMLGISRSADEAAEAPDGFYDKTAELGLSLLAIPEDLGGAGMPRSPLSNMLNAEDLAGGDMSLAIGALTPLSFVNAVIDNGTQEQIERYLPILASEKFSPATIALMEPRATFDPLQLKTTATRKGDGFVLNGEKSMVSLGDSAHWVLVVADLEGVPTGFVVAKGTAGVTCTNEEYMGLRPLATSRLVFEDVEIAAADKLGGDEKELDLQRLIDLGRIGICAMCVAVCQSVVNYTREYCNARVAFGEPITNRQSVAFMIGDMATETEAMRLMVYRAASRAEQGLEFHKEATLARIQCAKYGMEIGTNGVQLLGGHGFIREHLVELWYRNLRAIGVLDGCVVI